ncbi:MULTISPECIES: hypothetical protein [unclassified Haladaptatus]|uniref:DUF5789 family protein n=1 Tax=unclassified Haladaptatus TaxID=2622732 RepID=UPI00209BBDA3|nr:MULTISPECIES: hypothetical protein [unclassified Haladaptatus]MCO8246786.1 hypothetical protein [Haladaptatus sp. AB643]MCO8253689.1 hypothetical protein [Haladaptatus sp. AB618]
MSDREREQGIELGELSEKLDDHDYPADVDELVSEYGEYEIEYPRGSETFEEVIAPLDETYESADDVRQSILNMADSDAVGRQRYSDRGAGGAETTEQDPDQESF